jgi:hypothetical protein
VLVGSMQLSYPCCNYTGLSQDLGGLLTRKGTARDARTTLNNHERNLRRHDIWAYDSSRIAVRESLSELLVESLTLES